MMIYYQPKSSNETSNSKTEKRYVDQQIEDIVDLHTVFSTNRIEKSIIGVKKRFTHSSK